jgi:hypothetical protein
MAGKRALDHERLEGLEQVQVNRRIIHPIDFYHIDDEFAW